MSHSSMETMPICSSIEVLWVEDCSHNMACRQSITFIFISIPLSKVRENESLIIGNDIYFLHFLIRCYTVPFDNIRQSISFYLYVFI